MFNNLIDLTKIYTKKEFQDLLNSDLGFLISHYDLEGNKDFCDYYVVLIERGEDNNTEEIFKNNIDYKNADLGYFGLINVKLDLLPKLVNRAATKRNELVLTDENINKNIDENSCNFIYGFYSGILAMNSFLNDFFSTNDVIERDYNLMYDVLNLYN